MAVVTSVPKKLPLIFIYDDVLLPGSSMRIPVTSKHERKMVKSRLLGNDTLTSTVVGVITRKEEEKYIEISDSVPTIGTVAMVGQVTGTNWPRPTYTLLVTGVCRFQLEKITMEEPYPVGMVAFVDKHIIRKGKNNGDSDEYTDVMNDFKAALVKLLNLLDDTPTIIKLREMVEMVSMYSLPDLSNSIINATFLEKLDLLNALDITERFKKALPLLLRRIEGLKDEINKKPFQTTISVTLPKKDLFTLRFPRRLRSNDNTFGSSVDDDINDIGDLQERLRKAKLPPYAQKVADRELKRLKHLGPNNPEHGVIRSYVEFMAELPWAVSTKDKINIRKAREDLDAEHYGMKTLKRRVLEYLAVRQLKSNLKGPIMCFFGPPGVGKTSVSRSIANILGREFQRISLGGVSAQSEIRGHRKTYIGAMPGRILQAIKTAGVNNPVILLDEIDKLSHGMHGDPADALLEVLDPEQNCHFVDHYLNVPFDLSQVIFIATANRSNTISSALYDRLEFIKFDGYTQEEKLQIVLRHLLPKQMKENGLDENFIQIPSDSLQLVIKSYTLEAGVRELERRLGALCRAVAVKVAESGSIPVLTDAPVAVLAENNPETDAISEPPVFPIVLDEAAVEDILGPPCFEVDDSWSRLTEPGVARGLMFRTVGGIVTVIEVTKVTGGNGRLVLTGQLGNVLKESARLAFNWVRSVAERYGLVSKDGELLSGMDVHIHLPHGATPKDGPSAGITLATALVSLFSGIPVPTDLAMTGELSLRGLVYRIGGLKEKLHAAYRTGIKRVILPKQNEKDLFEIPEEVKNSLNFIFVSYMEEVIDVVFGGALSPKVEQKTDQLTSKL